jgi:hypothetical protein
MYEPLVRLDLKGERQRKMIALRIVEQLRSQDEQRHGDLEAVFLELINDSFSEVSCEQ